MKRKLKIGFIIVLIITLFVCCSILLNQPNDDILNNKMDSIIVVFMLAPILIIESEIYSICVYILTKEKNKVLSIFRIISLIMASLLFGFFILSFYTTSNKVFTILFVIFVLYVFSKLVILFKNKF